MLDPSALALALEAGVHAARAAAAPILERFRSAALRVDTKSDGSPVSEADRLAEEIIRTALRGRFPGIDVLGEEGGLQGGGSRLRWIVDPIDGTVSFVAGIPLFGTILGLEDTETGESLVGVIHLPALGETYAGAKGMGCFCNGKRISVEDGPQPRPGGESGRGGTPSPLSHVVLSCGDPRQFEAAGCLPDHARLAASPLFRGYSDAFGHAMALRGAVGVMVDPALSPWDLIATRLLVVEAGGALFTRPSLRDGKVDAIFGRGDLVAHVAGVLGWAPAPDPGEAQGLAEPEGESP